MSLVKAVVVLSLVVVVVVVLVVEVVVVVVAVAVAVVVVVVSLSCPGSLKQQHGGVPEAGVSSHIHVGVLLRIVTIG